MKNATVDYATFWSLVSSKMLLPQYIDAGDTYLIFAIENGISWEVNILKDGGSNQIDFETNHKASCNEPLEYRSEDGLPMVASSMFVDDLSFYADGSQGLLQVPSGTTQYIKYQISAPTVFALSGMDVYWYNANWGDYLNCEVGAYANPSDETTFISLDKFGNQYRIYQTGQRIFNVTDVKKIPPTITLNGVNYNTYVRITAVNVGPSNSNILFNIVGWIG
jgi:hypothetical protein